MKYKVKAWIVVDDDETVWSESEAAARVDYVLDVVQDRDGGVFGIDSYEVDWESSEKVEEDHGIHRRQPENQEGPEGTDRERQ